MNRKTHLIEALPIHKEICAYLIDKQVTFHCYNGGLKAIAIDSFCPYINEIIKKFNLKLEKESEKYYYYKSME